MCECGSLKVDEVAVRCFNYVDHQYHESILDFFDTASDSQKLTFESEIIDVIDSYLHCLVDFGFLCPELFSKVELKVIHQFTATYKNGMFVRNWS